MAKVRNNPWAVLVFLCLGFFMVLLDITIVNIAIPSMIDGLKAGLDQIIWVLNAYTLTYAVLLITAGRLGDRFGPRNLFAIGLAVFTLASAARRPAQRGGPSGGPLRPPQSLRDRARRLHPGLGGLRAVSGSQPADRGAGGPGCRRRAAHPANAGPPDHDLSATAARSGLRRLGRHRRHRDHRRAHGGRPAGHLPRLAGHLLRQRPDRHRGPDR